MRFENQVAIVTGGNRGIGYAVAECLVKEGASVAVVCTTPEGARRAAESLGGNCRGYACNVADSAAVNTTVEAILADFGKAVQDCVPCQFHSAEGIRYSSSCVQEIL